MTQEASVQHELRHSLESAGYDITNCPVKCEEPRNHQQFHKHPPNKHTHSHTHTSCWRPVLCDNKPTGRCRFHFPSLETRVSERRRKHFGGPAPPLPDPLPAAHRPSTPTQPRVFPYWEESWEFSSSKFYKQFCCFL